MVPISAYDKAVYIHTIPHTAQTIKLAPELPTYTSTNCGDIKIPEPIMMPATKDTALVSPNSCLRVSFSFSTVFIVLKRKKKTVVFQISDSENDEMKK